MVGEQILHLCHILMQQKSLWISLAVARPMWHMHKVWRQLWFGRDGIPQEAVTAFASLGSFGTHASNAERDLHRWLRGVYGVSLEPYFIEIMLETQDVDEEAGKPLTAPTRVPVILPHEVFAEIHASSEYQVPTGHGDETFCTRWYVFRLFP